MVVQHNISAMNANRYYGINNSGLSKSLEKLSSGYAINRAGDNAAGLAVSEKMRSQIAGITQAVKNAQDGISMIQTFEGALTETDSILQRMKTLANQSANGTYQDDVDREAIQLEFDQLNDELNQIADTDFNGVICLNGGVMADGLEEVGGKFDYRNAGDQLQAKKDDLNAKIAAEKARTPGDITTKEDDNGNKIMNALTDIDDTKYDGTAATNLWKDLKLDSTAKSVDIAFSATKAADGTVSYAATSGKVYDKDGEVIKKLTADDLKAVTATAASKSGATGLGGFSVKSTSNSGGMANAVFDATQVDTSDMLTLTFTGPAEAAKAPTNVGLADKYADDGTDGDLSEYDYSSDKSKGTGATVTLGAVTDVTMTKEINEFYKGIDGAEITATATTSNAAPQSLGAIDLGSGLTLGTDGTIKLADGTQVAHGALTTGVLTITSGENGTTAGATELLKIDMSQMFSTATNATANGDTAKFTIVLDSYSYPDATAAPDVNAKASEPDMTAINASVKALEDELAALDKKGVSISNSFENAAIPMTYTDHIILQTGARSKDAVDFTFKYSSNGMGKLTANMDCSAREGGLNTASLSLRTAKDANAAIDQIDHAINKVSMVRATFGAVQNRLEHKVDNMNVTKENLTSAESRIRDTNMAEEMSNFTKNQILSQASQSMLAQANSLPQSVLQLLG